MSKLVVDLSAEELDQFADEAWRAAATEALSKGLPVTGSRDGRRYRYFPDGRVEDLGAVMALPGLEIGSPKTASTRQPQ
jgi:hypothetical protein